MSTVEHALSALAGLGIWDALLELHGEELPAQDGSALPFARLLLEASRPRPDTTRGCFRVHRSFSIRRGRSACHLLPAQDPVLECTIEFSHQIGHQHLRLPLDDERYLERLAPARSFGLQGDAAALRSVGLARGASLRNTLVFGSRGALNPSGTRFHDEPVRHKLLDAVGDLALLGAPFCGHLRLERCGHALLLATLGRACTSGALRRER